MHQFSYSVDTTSGTLVPTSGPESGFLSDAASAKGASCVVVCWCAGRFPKVDASDKGTETDTNQNQQLCYHVLGQPQSQDVVVLADPEHPLWMFGAEVTDDGR
jgi:hypothetical protein